MEPEDELEEDGDTGYVELTEGVLTIWDYPTFRDATNSLAVHVTAENGIFVLDADTLEWRSFPLAGPVKKLRGVPKA